MNTISWRDEEMKEFLKQEELKLQLKMIFNDEYKDYKFANSRHMEIVLQYGKTGLSFHKSLEAANNHNKISLEISKTVHFVDEHVDF